MMQLRTLSAGGQWYKGNLHIHTTLSDGQLAPEEITREYQQNGYSFISITDHWLYGVHSDLQSDSFLIFPGVEVDTPIPTSPGRDYHIVAFSTPDRTPWPHNHTFDDINQHMNVVELIGYMIKHQQLCVVAHPNWSQRRMEEFDQLDDCIGVEVYNNVCHLEYGRGYAESYFERRLWRNQNGYCFACDDTHPAVSLFGGFIWVKADALSHESIFSAVQRGSFFASNGPRIHDFYIENNTAHVTCSPCKRISFHGESYPGSCDFSDNSSLIYAAADVTDASYIYCVCEDNTGKAWTQPIYLQ